MGLCLSCKEKSVNFSYSGFHEFRKTLAQHIGIDLEEMDGFRKKHPRDEMYVKPGHRKWEDIDSPFKCFLNHSDYNGKLTFQECREMYPLIGQILIFTQNKYFKEQLGEIENIFLYAIKNEEDIVFC